MRSSWSDSRGLASLVGRPNGPNCAGCPLQPLATGFARTDGGGSLGVLIVAEALGEDEAAAGRPLVGKAGKIFDRMVQRAGLDRSSFLLANTINCRPPDNKLHEAWYETLAISHCSPYLDETIARFKPKAILAMGDTALTRLTGRYGVNAWRGYVVPTPYGFVIPTYHPSFIGRGNFRLAKVFIHDLKKAVKVAEAGNPISPTRYLLRPSPAEATRWAQEYFAQDPLPPLALDIETPFSGGLDEDMAAEEDVSYVIERIGFSWKPNTAITMPWMPPFTDIARKLCGSYGPKLVWNEAYDIPRLDASESPVNGRIYDVMWAYHMLHPEWPYGLKYAATFYSDLPQWKSQSKASPEWYNAVDNDATVRVYEGVKKGLEAAGQWETYERHVVDLSQVLRRMSRRGVLVDPALRARERAHFEERFKETVGTLNGLVDPGLRPHHPKSGYKKTQEQLIKAKLWQEGEMVVVGVMDVKEKPPAPVKEPTGAPGAGRKKRTKRIKDTVKESGEESELKPSLPS